MALKVCNNIRYEHRYLICYIMQIIAVFNAIKDGWKVKQLGNSTYEFTKLSNEEDDIDLYDFVNKIMTF